MVGAFDTDKTLPLLARYGVRIWSVFFLVPTGRGRAEDMITPQEVVNAIRGWPPHIPETQAALRAVNALCAERGIFHLSDEAYAAAAHMADGLDGLAGGYALGACVNFAAAASLAGLARADEHRDILLAVDGEADRRRHGWPASHRHQEPAWSAPERLGQLRDLGARQEDDV